MANARFLLENKLATATVLNGTAGTPTPPARTEVDPFVMERALNSDRRSVWKLDAENGTYFPYGYQLDLDAGASTTLDCIALGGLSCPGGEIVEIKVGYLNAYPSGGYNEVAGVVLSGSAERDGVAVFTSTSKRYWFVWIDATASPVIGSLRGGLMMDVGAAPNFGSQMTPFRNRVEQQLEDGSILINELGPDGADFSLNFSPILESSGALLLNLQKTAGSVTYVDPDDVGYEVFLKGGRVNIVRLGGGVVSASLELGRCP